MNKNLRSMLLVLTTVGVVSADVPNNKTVLNTRICRDEIPAFTTFHELIANKDSDRLGGNLQVTGFYGKSTNGKDLAKNFGADGGTTILVAGPLSTPAITLPTRPTVYNELLLHTAGTANALAGTLNFDPKQTVYGARFDYFQRIDKLVEGLFFSLNLPIVHVTNDINMTVANAVEEDNVKLYDLFTGKTNTRTAGTAYQQEALKYAKMESNSETGLGDLEARIGWRFIESHKAHVGVNVAVVFPTSDDIDGDYLWEARAAENKWGLGAGADASAVLWEEKDQNLKIIADLQYKYLFEGSEKRTISLNEIRYADTTMKTIKNPILSEYYLAGKVGVAGLKPLANITTLDVDVTPGSQINGTAAFAYNNGGFILEVGYNMFWKQDEDVELKNSWNNNTYAIYAKNINNTTAIAADGTNSLVGALAGTTVADRFIKSTDLNLAAAESASQFIHTPFVGVGYIAKTWDYPVEVGANVGYSFPSTNRNAAEGYFFSAKLGVAF